jgi:methionyl-tRNA formyltransferase
MKLVFMGTPELARVNMEALLQAGFEVAAVFTQPDRPVGRGWKIEESPVKKLALEKKIPIYQPEKLKNNPGILEVLKNTKPDLIVVVAYGHFLPTEILTLPQFGCINVHASLLPKYRGASPIQAAILNGEKTTGISIIFISEKMDEGNIIAEKEVAIQPEETAGELEPRLAALGAQLLVATIPQIAAGKIKRIPQATKKIEPTYAPLIKKEDGLIDWNQPAETIKNKIRAFNPWPAAFSYLNNKYVKILRSVVPPETPTRPAATFLPGEIISISKKATLIQTGAGLINLQEIQPEGRKVMTPFEFSLGRSLKVGDVFATHFFQKT